jgi:hypothetical protein
VTKTDESFDIEVEMSSPSVIIVGAGVGELEAI